MLYIYEYIYICGCVLISRIPLNSFINELSKLSHLSTWRFFDGYPCFKYILIFRVRT
jgi:hypothetical protein